MDSDKLDEVVKKVVGDGKADDKKWEDLADEAMNAVKSGDKKKFAKWLRNFSKVR